MQCMGLTGRESGVLVTVSVGAGPIRLARSAIATVLPLDALAVMRVGRRQVSRRRRYHFTLGDLTLRENGCRVMAIDFGTAATRELYGS